MTMRDQNKKLLVTAKRSRNMLYKVHMGIKNPTCLHLATEKESSRWHTRLGLINTETMRNMIQKDTEHYHREGSMWVLFAWETSKASLS